MDMDCISRGEGGKDSDEGENAYQKDGVGRGIKRACYKKDGDRREGGIEPEEEDEHGLAGGKKTKKKKKKKALQEAVVVQSTLVCRVCKSEFMSEADIYKLVTCLHVFCRPCLGAAAAKSLVALKPLKDVEAEDALAGLVPCPVAGCPDSLRREDLRFVVGANIMGFLDDWVTSVLVQKVLRPVLRRCPNCEEAPQLLLPHQLDSLPMNEIGKAYRRNDLTLGSLDEPSSKRSSKRLTFNYLSALKDALASAPAFFLCSSCLCLVCKDCGACLTKLLVTQASAAYLGAHRCNPSLKQCFEMARSMMKLCASYSFYVQGEGSTKNRSSPQASQRALFSVTISNDHGDLKLKSSWLQDVFGQQNDMKNSLKQNTDMISDDINHGYDIDGEDFYSMDEVNTPTACKRSFKPSLTSVVDIQALEALQELRKMLLGMFKENKGNEDMRYQVPPAITALLCSHDLPCKLLKWLIKNLDSMIMDVTGRSSSLYSELVAFMRLLSGNSDLFPLLCSPQAKYDCWADKSRWKTAGSVMAAFENLYRQAQFTLRSKQLLQYEQFSREEGQKEQQHAPLVDLALVSEIEDVYKQLRRKIRSWEQKTSQNKWLADASGFFHDRIWERLPSPNYNYAAEMYDVIKSLCEGSSAASREASSCEGSSINKQIEAYKKALRPLQFREGPLLPNHYFRTEIMKSKGTQNKKRARAIALQIVQLNTALPLEWGSSIFVRIDDHRPDVLRALIIGPSGTPYQNGVFIFDMLLDEDYPQTPPKMMFLTTGGGTIRFNPNLYETGFVCLSLLGTWTGPSWKPSESTILQVLVSIQALVLVADPYYNEPLHHEKPATCPLQIHSAGIYMRRQRQNTLRYSMLPALWAPDPLFKDVILTHFRLKAVEIQEQCDAWISDKSNDFRRDHEDLIKASEYVKDELAKLLA